MIVIIIIIVLVIIIVIDFVIVIVIVIVRGLQEYSILNTQYYEQILKLFGHVL